MGAVTILYNDLTILYNRMCSLPILYKYLPSPYIASRCVALVHLFPAVGPEEGPEALRERIADGIASRRPQAMDQARSGSTSPSRLAPR